MSVTKETILLYLLDQLDNHRQDEVEKALREDKQLHSFYRERLADFEASGLLDPPFEEVEDFDDDSEELNVDLSQFEEQIVHTGDPEFDCYAHLPAEEAARLFILDQIRKRIQSERTAEPVTLIPKTLVARYSDDALSVAARDSQSKSSRNQTEPQADSLIWSNGDQDQILLRFLSATDRDSVRLRVTFTVLPKDSYTLLSFATDPIDFKRDGENKQLWIGELSLRNHNLHTDDGTIISLEANSDE